MSKYKINKTMSRQEYRIHMLDLEVFCKAHNIKTNEYKKNSFYFEIDGQKYRVSGHTIAESNAAAYVNGRQVRKLYHPDGELPDVFYISASKHRLKQIYNDIASGYKVDEHGYVIGERRN